MKTISKNLILNILILSIGLILVGCSTTCNVCQAKKDLTKHVNMYEVKSHAFVKLVNDKTSAKALVLARAKELVELAKPILSGLQKKYPQCREYLQTVLSNSQKMQSLSLEQIEQNWHEGNALPDNADSVCIESKELVVHPSTVVILVNNDFASKKNKEQMSDEISEVIEHMSDLKESI